MVWWRVERGVQGRGRERPAVKRVAVPARLPACLPPCLPPAPAPFPFCISAWPFLHPDTLQCWTLAALQWRGNERSPNNLPAALRLPSPPHHPSAVLDAVGTAVATLELQDLFRDRAGLVAAVQRGLGSVLRDHGYALQDCLITVCWKGPVCLGCVDREGSCLTVLGAGCCTTTTPHPTSPHHCLSHRCWPLQPP